VALVCFCILKY